MNLPNQKTAQLDTASLGSPLTGPGRLAALENALAADEQALFGSSNTTTPCDVALSQLAAPAAVATTNGGTVGVTAYSYVVADVGSFGLAPSLAGATATGNAVLTTANYNIIAWTAIIGHTYNIYRSVAAGTPATLGLVGTVAATKTGMTFNDTGLTATGNVPAYNTTGSGYLPGSLFVDGRLFRGCKITTLTDVANHTLATSDILTSLLLNRAGGAALSDTLPTAAQIVAAIPGVKANMGFELYIRNTNSGTLTLVAPDASVTLAAGNTNTIATVHVKKLLFVVTNATPGAEAVTVYALEDTAY